MWQSGKIFRGDGVNDMWRKRQGIDRRRKRVDAEKINKKGMLAKRGGEERGINPRRCWLERGQAVSASSTCCHSEDWGVKLVSAQALRGVRWLWGKRGRETETFRWRDIERKRKIGTDRVNVSIKPASGIMAEWERTTDWDEKCESARDRNQPVGLLCGVCPASIFIWQLLKP